MRGRCSVESEFELGAVLENMIQFSISKSLSFGQVSSIWYGGVDNYGGFGANVMAKGDRCFHFIPSPMDGCPIRVTSVTVIVVHAHFKV